MEGSCPDCAAEPGEIHHAYCDWARKPDGSQILIDAVTYWVPFEDQDPRKAASEYLFIVEEPLNPENSESESVQNIAAFLSLDGATNYINNEEENDLEVDVLQILDHEEAHRPNGEWTAHIVIMPPAEGEEYPKVPQNICAHIQKANAVKYVEEDNITPLEIHPVTVKHTS